LVTQRLSAAGGHDDHGIAAADQPVDDLVLWWSELGKTKGLL